MANTAKNIHLGIADKKEVFHKALLKVNESINKLALVSASL